jgi:hypothetical protein
MSQMSGRRVRTFLQKAKLSFDASAELIPTWREAAGICALADSERHLGHAVRAHESWIAYDANRI